MVSLPPIKGFYNRNRGRSFLEARDFTSTLPSPAELGWHRMTRGKPIVCFLQIYFDGWIEIQLVPVANQEMQYLGKVFGSNSSCNLYSSYETQVPCVLPLKKVPQPKPWGFPFIDAQKGSPTCLHELQEVCLLSSHWFFLEGKIKPLFLRIEAFPLKKWSSCMQGISDSCRVVGFVIFGSSFGNSLVCFLKKRVSVPILVGITDLIWSGPV